MTQKMLVLGALLALLVAPAAEAAKKPKLVAFQSCASLLKYSRFHALETMGRGRPMPPPPMAVGGAPQADANRESVATSAPAPAAAPGSGGDAPAFSDTNVQEAGVDEPDVVKTDGRRMFAIANGKLRSLSVSGEGSPKLLGSLDLPRGGDQRLFLIGDKVLVMSGGMVYGGPMPVEGPMPATMPSGGPEARPASVSPLPYSHGTTTLTLVDVSDPAAMRISRTLTAEGRFLDARRTGTTARVVIDAVPRALQFGQSADQIKAARAARWLPRGVLQRGRKGRRTFMRLADCDDVRRPPEFSGLDALTVMTIDVSRGLSPVDSDAVLTGADTVYASQNSLYLASQQWNEQTTTLLHKLDVSKPDTTTYRATGEVTGSLLNQFSLSEHDGVLRVATTSFDYQSESFVTTLGEREGRLVQLGKVGGLGRDERIYAVRFIGDKGYVVTFRQVDPLYTLDLSNAAEPRVVGELKIMGYSAYLHPIGDDLLIGVGQDATEEGRALGTQVSLFDVSNPRNPVRLQQRRLGERWSSSTAEHNHHAFLWWPQSNLAVLPVHLNNGSFTGAIGVRVRREGIEEVGRISHPGEAQMPVQRALVVGERIFTLSPVGVRANRLDDLADLDWLPFGAQRR